MNKKIKFEKADNQLLVKNFLRDWSAIEYKYNPPSALKNEQRYAQYGIKLPFKLHYDYKIPFGFESSYDLLFWLPFAEAKNKMPITETEWGDFHRIRPDNMREVDNKRLELYRSVAPEQFNAICDYILQISADEMVAEIKRLNPELAHIKTDGKESGVSRPLMDFINGVAYGFPPEDIELCLNSKRGELQKVADSPRYSNLRVGHFTTLEHYEDFLQAEQKIQQIQQAKQNNGKE